jgi:hypothetical protein
MPENETQWRNREREFQKAVLTALEKPKQSKFVAILNSPFFLWLVSAAFITVVGSYISAQQSCFSEAERLIQDFNQVNTEVEYREFNLANSFRDATSLDDLKTKLKAPNLLSQYKDKRLFELIANQRTDYSSVQFDEQLWMKYHKGEDLILPTETYFATPADVQKTGKVLVDALGKQFMLDFDASPLKEDDFKKLRELLINSFLPLNRHQLTDLRYISNCQPSTVFARLLGRRSKIIAARDKRE